MRIIGIVAVGMIVGSCGLDAPRPESVVATDLDTLITTASGLIGMPIDVVITATGAVAVADFQANQIMVVDPHGNISAIGRPGDGPGEFAGVWGLQVSGDDLLAIDRGNGRVQQVTTNGSYLDSWPTSPLVGASFPYLLPDGGLLLASMGRDSTLAFAFDRDGNRTGIGTAVTAAPAVRSFTAIRGAIDRGELPDELRNEAVVAGRPDGTVWIGLQADGVLQAYGPDRSLRWTTPVHEPEMGAVREQFFERNRSEEQSNRYYPLHFFADLVPLEDELWVLMTTLESGAAAVVLVLGDEGAVRRRIEIPGAAGANSLSVGASRKELVLSTFHDAQILLARLPGPE